MQKNDRTQFHYEVLQNNLREFGLNPKDWFLRPCTQVAHRFFFFSKQDPTFIFEGKACLNGDHNRLVSLELASL